MIDFDREVQKKEKAVFVQLSVTYVKTVYYFKMLCYLKSVFLTFNYKNYPI